MDNTFVFSHLLNEADVYQNYVSKVKAQMSLDASSNDDEVKRLLYYSKINIQRMHRWDKVLAVNSEFSNYIMSIEEPLTLLVITESWCVDAAQLLSLLNKISILNTRISFKILSRDKHPELMDAYLTGGKRSIPILIGLTKTGSVEKEMFRWGPSPEGMLQYKENYQNENPSSTLEEFVEAMQIWFNKDKSDSTQKELYILIKESI